MKVPILKLEELLNKLDMSQTELKGKLLEIGINARAATIHHIVKNTIVRIPVELIYGISKVTGTRPNDWIYWDEDEEK